MSRTRPLTIVTVVGARPQFVKAAAISRAIATHNRATLDAPIEETIVHTGQHYDDNMSRVFFEQLHIPRPAMDLGVRAGRHGEMTGAMMERIEGVLVDLQPDWVLTYGDTNSTLAAALAAAKLHVPIAHVEAGLRSYNRRMPEEINRVLTDVISTVLFCPTDVAVANLAREGITEGIHQVGDVMYDSVLFNAALAQEGSAVLDELGLEPGGYRLATVHRAENTDDPARLDGILHAFDRITGPIVLPLHPRTRKVLAGHGRGFGDTVRVVDPVPYLDMLMLERSARTILTDSGGVQKEAYWFDVPCVTLRDETEWVETVDVGGNRVVGADSDAIVAAVAAFDAEGDSDRWGQPLYGDGRCAERIVGVLAGG